MSDRKKDRGLAPHPDAIYADPPVEDPELRSVLRQWRVPEVSATLDDRIMAAYGQRINPVPFGAQTTALPHLRPVVFAAAVILCSLISIWLILQTPHDGRLRTRQPVGVAGQAHHEEFPVIQEIALEDFEGETRYFTYINLSGFQPVEAIKVRIIKRSHADEN